MPWAPSVDACVRCGFYGISYPSNIFEWEIDRSGVVVCTKGPFCGVCSGAGERCSREQWEAEYARIRAEVDEENWRIAVMRAAWHKTLGPSGSVKSLGDGKCC